MLGSSWVAAQLAASQEGLSSMSEWVSERPQGALGMSLWNHEGGGPRKYGNHCYTERDGGMSDDLEKIWKESTVT
jgi:hypothetical protein